MYVDPFRLPLAVVVDGGGVHVTSLQPTFAIGLGHQLLEIRAETLAEERAGGCAVQGGRQERLGLGFRPLRPLRV